jgi:hypothetical protein
MMGSKERRFAPLIQISLEELFPQDHFYRHLERTLDLSFVRKFVQQAYATGGRPDTTSGHTLPGRAGGTLSAECPAP